MLDPHSQNVDVESHIVYRVPESPGRPSEYAPLTPSTASECAPHLGPRGGEGHTLACGKGWREPIQTKGQTLQYFVC
jgi:hypothetical protein